MTSAGGPARPVRARWRSSTSSRAVDRDDALPQAGRRAGPGAASRARSSARACGRDPLADRRARRAGGRVPAGSCCRCRDDGAQMRSGSTREVVALHTIATHYGSPGTRRDRATSSRCFATSSTWPYLCALQNPADLSRELDAVARRPDRVASRRHRLRHPQRRARGPRPAIRQARPRRPRAAPAGSASPISAAPPEADRMTTTPPQRENSEQPSRSTCLAAGSIGPQADAPALARPPGNRTTKSRRAPSSPSPPPRRLCCRTLASPSAKGPARTVKAGPDRAQRQLAAQRSP